MDTIIFQDILDTINIVQKEKNILLKKAVYNTINTVYFNRYNELKYIVKDIHNEDYYEAILDAIYYHFDEIVNYLLPLIQEQSMPEITKYAFYHGSSATMQLINVN